MVSVMAGLLSPSMIAQAGRIMVSCCAVFAEEKRFPANATLRGRIEHVKSVAKTTEKGLPSA